MSLRALFIGSKVECSRSCGHLPSQLSELRNKKVYPGWSRSCETYPSQLRGPRGCQRECLDKSLFHLLLCLFLLCSSFFSTSGCSMTIANISSSISLSCLHHICLTCGACST